MEDADGEYDTSKISKSQNVAVVFFSLVHDKDGLDLTPMFYTRAGFVSAVLCRSAASAEGKDERPTDKRWQGKDVCVPYGSAVHRLPSSELLPLSSLWVTSCCLYCVSLVYFTLIPSTSFFFFRSLFC